MSANKSWKLKLQKFGGVMTGMIMPNIGAFIAWGLLTALFIPTGWIPHEGFVQLVGPGIVYLLPLLIAYTAGTNAYGGRRGGVIGAVATLGVIIGSDVPQLLGAMVMGHFSAKLMKAIDRALEGKIKTGLEMLVDNFGLGILGGILMLLGYIAIGPIMTVVSDVLAGGVGWLTDRGLIPLTALLVQPGQVLFLNNAINHGIMVPLGVLEVAEYGRSILFLVEANGGIWLGLIAAFMIFGKGMAKRSAVPAFPIMWLGGIGEVAFPYALIKPVVILGPMLGNMAALLWLQIMGGGTVGAVSPGSMIALILMSPSGFIFINLMAYIIGVGVSFLVVSFFLKLDKSTPEDEVEMAPEAVNIPGVPVIDGGTSAASGSVATKRNIKKLVVACDGGMGSSAMGLSILKTKLRKAMIDVEVSNVSVRDIPSDVDAVITHANLKEQVQGLVGPDVLVLSIENFLDNNQYDNIVKELKAAGAGA